MDKMLLMSVAPGELYSTCDDHVKYWRILVICAPNCGVLPYETEHQVCRGDIEEDIENKTM